MDKHKRTAHRWPLLAMITAGVFLAAGSFWLVQVMNRPDVSFNPDAGDEPDYIIEKFSFVRMTPDGKPRYLFHGERLTHRPHSDVSIVERPILKNLTPGAPPMTARANSARIRHQDNEVDLLGNVDISRPASATTRAMQMQTEALTVLPDEDRMKTDQQVKMTMGSATITGMGMQANDATRQITMGRGRMVYPPPAAR
ncbi:LPS export ABC transporter periplasmic protein LptC [Massilia sp. PAMC28688]|uniref:LPS export ABC transporter periplasmic protein LptC n=1 Tax=Massilia sp. PAMC28688 TaxID=2861283 RepID=UPI001C62C89C|nr:LPS export ABC transporter periplasmic protein LptC [Massilia sp. PAMC28688]QYF94752.1 LPS export ABC transporter periplasmic protein LptC [Massilia sp. PAMC28688]